MFKDITAMATNGSRVSPSARQFPSGRVINAVTKKITFDNTALTAGEVFPAALPANAIITGVSVAVATAFNAGTTNPVTVGITPTGSEIATAAEVGAGVVGGKVALTGLGMAPLAADTPIYASYIPTGTAATAGAAYVTISYAVV